jgi:hypothetical protein
MLHSDTIFEHLFGYERNLYLFFHQDMATAHTPNGPVCPASYLHQFSIQIFSASTLCINIFCHLFFIIIMTSIALKFFNSIAFFFKC